MPPPRRWPARSTRFASEKLSQVLARQGAHEGATAGLAGVCEILVIRCDKKVQHLSRGAAKIRGGQPLTVRTWPTTGVAPSDAPDRAARSAMKRSTCAAMSSG